MGTCTHVSTIDMLTPQFASPAACPCRVQRRSGRSQSHLHRVTAVLTHDIGDFVQGERVVVATVILLSATQRTGRVGRAETGRAEGAVVPLTRSAERARKTVVS